MPGFGDTFVQSMQFGTQIAQRQDEKQQEERQFATQIALKERDMQATQAMEALKMDALNRQITIAEETKANQAKYQYDTLHDARMKYAHDDYISVKGDPAFKNIPKTSAQQVMDMYKIGGISPDDEFVPKEQFALVKARENFLWQLNVTEQKETAKTNKEDAFFKRMTDLTELANKNARGLTKQETIPGEEPGLLVKSYRGWKGSSDSWNIPGTPVVNPAWWLGLAGRAIKGIGNAFSSGSQTQTQSVIDESKLGPAMDKQAEIIQTMEIGLMDKKVNPKIADTYLDPQKSTLIQMADSRLVKDKDGVPIDIGNIQGLSPVTIGKIKDILSEIRMQQLINQSKDLSNQKTELQVEQLQEKVQ